jgi:hypothetical protein
MNTKTGVVRNILNTFPGSPNSKQLPERFGQEVK